MDTSMKFAESQDLAGKIASLFRKRTDAAVADHAARVQAAHTQYAESCKAIPGNMQQTWSEPYYYAVDFLQRSILFWDALRQRGNDYVERTQKGVTPVLKFDYEMIADARTFAKPVNYALVSIVPPAGVQVDPGLRPYEIGRAH